MTFLNFILMELPPFELMKLMWFKSIFGDGSCIPFKFQINTNYFPLLLSITFKRFYIYVKSYHNILCCQGKLYFEKNILEQRVNIPLTRTLSPRGARGKRGGTQGLPTPPSVGTGAGRRRREEIGGGNRWRLTGLC